MGNEEKKKKNNKKLSQNWLQTWSVVKHFKSKKRKLSSHEQKRIIKKLYKKEEKKIKLESVLTKNLSVVKRTKLRITQNGVSQTDDIEKLIDEKDI